MSSGLFFFSFFPFSIFETPGRSFAPSFIFGHPCCQVLRTLFSSHPSS
jgi:hypothetical protein